MVKLIRWNEKPINRSNPDYSITYVKKDIFNVFNEKDDIDLGNHHVSRLKDNLGLSDEQLSFIKKNGTTNFRIIRSRRK